MSLWHNLCADKLLSLEYDETLTSGTDFSDPYLLAYGLSGRDCGYFIRLV